METIREVDFDGQKLRITLLGQVTVQGDSDGPVKVASKRNALFIGLLALQPGKQIPRDEVAAAIWPDVDVQIGRRNLRQLVFLVRTFLEPFGDDLIVVNEETVGFAVNSISTDIEDFYASAAGNQQADWERAVDLYRGHFLDEADDMTLLWKRQELSDLYVSTLFKLITQYYSQNQFAPAIALARRAVQTDPLDERSRFALVRLLGANGQLSAAKSEYDDLASRLESELGIQPSIPLARLLRKASQNRAKDIAELISGRDTSAKPATSWFRWIAGATLGGILMSALWLGFRQPHTLKYEDLSAELTSISSTASREPNLARRADLFLQMGELAWQDVYGPKEDFWRSELVPQTDSLLRTMEWLVLNDPSKAAQLGGALERYFLLINKQEQWGAHLRSALEKATEERSAMYARAEVAYAIAVPGASELTLKKRLAHALSVYRELGDQVGEAQTIRIQGFIQAHRRRNIESRVLYEEALALSRKTNNERQIALCQLCLGIAGPDPRDDPDQDLARRVQCMLESFDRFRGLSNVWGARLTASNLAVNAELLANRGSANQVVRECTVRLVNAAEYEETLANAKGQYSNLAAAVRLLIKLKDDVAAAKLLTRFLTEGIGAGLSIGERHQLSVACYRLSPEVYKRKFSVGDPSSPTEKSASQSPQEIVFAVLK